MVARIQAVAILLAKKWKLISRNRPSWHLKNERGFIFTILPKMIN